MKKNIIYLLVFFLSSNILYGCAKKASSEYEMHEKTNMISAQILELKSVDEANVLLTKDTALIGIDLKNNQILEISSKKMLRKEIKQIVSNIDPKINNIFISSNSDINMKINNISQNMNKGKKVDIKWEIKNIVNKFTPNV